MLFSKKQYKITKDNKLKILKQIDNLTNLPDGIFFKIKESENEYYIKFIIDITKCNIQIDDKFKNVPDCITFLVIIDYSFPLTPPKIIAKTVFSFPNLVDGRNLSYDIIPNWSIDSTLSDIANSMVSFLKKFFSNNNQTSFYGKFEIGAVYDLSNFNNMLVNTFPCKTETNSEIPNDQREKLFLVLSDDCIILFEKVESNPSYGKVIFWSTLYALSNIQINKMNKIVCLYFYWEEKQLEKQIRIIMQNVLFFREALVKRMMSLRVKVEEKKLFKGQMQERRITEKEISEMSIEDIEKNLKFLGKKIEHNEINYYVVSVFSELSRRATEIYSINGDDGHLAYLNEFKNLLMRKDVQMILKEVDN